jgi:DNA polymerase-3 subunit alpha
MPDVKQIRKEITDAIKKKRGDKISEDLWKAIETELDICEITDGLGGKNNLQTFYNIWQKRKDKVGNKNEINSWIAYSLGFTSKKPDGEFLFKRRAFARAGFPDIDVDFEDSRQNDVFEYLVDTYGRDKGGRIGTHQFLTFKSCITRVVKALDIADAFHKGKDVMTTENAKKVSEILESFPKGGVIRLRGDDGEMHLIKTIKDAYEHSPDFKHYMDKYPLLKKHSFEVEKTFSAFGSHAAGYVISDIPIEKIAPLRRATGDALCTQFTGPELESLGLIKFDILGLSTLSVIKKCLELIKENYDIDIDIANLSLTDEPTFKLYRTGNLGGVFQCEQSGMQHTMREIGVDRFEDIMAGVALYRPGPMDNIPDYCARKKGEQQIDYFHPSIEPFVKKHLEKTYGILVYQEQIMNICSSLAGFSITDGYIMIKAIGKKKIELMKKFENQFIEGAMNNGVPKEVIEQYWSKFIVPFSNYGFNAAHACCYGFNSYITAYLKANYPDEFICATLITETKKNSGTKFEKLSGFEREFKKKLAVKFLSRNINDCKLDYVIEKKKDLQNGVMVSEIRPSLICKGLGWVAAKEIEKNQPFENLKDFAEKNGSSVDTKAVLALVVAGYFGAKPKKNSEAFVRQFAIIKEDIKKVRKKGIESVDIFG